MRRKTVAVAMSGGVDSSVCAALLQGQGFKVIGITMQILRDSVDNGCSALDNIKDAKRVADKLGIFHYVLDVSGILRKKVIADFCREYQRGRTPNPCIRCNQYIKFDYLLKKAKQLGASYIATGHYARIEFDRKKKRYLLKKGRDSRKEQSYFLYTLTQRQLRHTLMPLGKLTKQRARAIARKKGLPVAERLESQEICFIPDNNYGAFLKQQIPQIARPGPIVNKQGEIIGRHKGIIFYTVGQREGLGIAFPRPLYVISINKKDNTIMVGEREDVYSDELIADKLNFISMDRLKKPMRVKAKVRYLHPLAWATVIPQGKDRVKVKFDRPQFAITPGQAALFYKGDTVVGGGIIQEKFAFGRNFS